MDCRIHLWTAPKYNRYNIAYMFVQSWLINLSLPRTEDQPRREERGSLSTFRPLLNWWEDILKLFIKVFALIFSTNIFVLDIFSVLRCCVQNRLTKFARGEFWLTVNAFMEFPRHEMCHRLQTMEICQYVVGKFNIFLHRIKITTDKCFAEGCPFICRISSEPRLCSVELQTNVIWRFLMISQSRRRSLLGLSPGWKCPIASESHLSLMIIVSVYQSLHNLGSTRV